ncbi:hypothetical protein JCM8097_005752 [Rhodosporidiobolus ruineniae]
MSSTPSSPPCLPPELHLHTLKLAYPPDAEDDYTGRSRDILQCCLVSKTWQELAEPLLWRSVTLTGQPSMRLVAEQPLEKRCLTRNLAFDLPDEPLTSSAHLREALRLFPDVEHARIRGPVDEKDASFMDELWLSDFSLVPNVIERFETVETTVSGAEKADVVFQYPFRAVLLNLEEGDLLNWHHRECLSSDVPWPPLYFRLNASSISWSLLHLIFLFPHRPKCIFLPTTPLVSNDSKASDELVREAFLRRCKDEGIEVRYYRRAEEEWRAVECREFREYIQERKSREEAERS